MAGLPQPGQHLAITTNCHPSLAEPGVYGGEQNVYGIGVNWYQNDVLRFMLDYDIVNVDRLNAAGTTQIGRRFQDIGFRAQAAF